MLNGSLQNSSHGTFRSIVGRLRRCTVWSTLHYAISFAGLLNVIGDISVTIWDYSLTRHYAMSFYSLLNIIEDLSVTIGTIVWLYNDVKLQVCQSGGFGTVFSSPSCSVFCLVSFVSCLVSFSLLHILDSNSVGISVMLKLVSVRL
jgi:hypothetical protein